MTQHGNSTQTAAPNRTIHAESEQDHVGHKQLLAFVQDELTRNRSQYLAFIQKRLSDRELGEDILQASFMRALEKAHTLKEPKAIEGWFYGILRNAIIDAHRRRASKTRALESLAQEIVTPPEAHEEVGAPCKCVGILANRLKPEYQSALQRIDVEGAPVKSYAEQEGLTASHAGVRVHRARRALLKEVTATCGHCASDGCQNCTCANVQGLADLQTART